VTFRDRARSFFEHRSIVLIVSIIAALLASPALRQGLYVDDHFHRDFVLGTGRGAPLAKGWLWMFSFFDGDPARTQWMVDHGMMPWWSDVNVRVNFFRPLSSLTHVFDHRVLGHPALMHLHSIAWYVLVVAVVASLYRRLIGGYVAGLAAFMFAVDFTHGMLAAWLANRNALVAAAFGAMTLLFHDRWRREKRPRDAALAAGALAVGLCGGESALAIMGYVVAHAAFLDREQGARRLRALLPYAPVILAYVVIYRVGHFGSRHSGMYLDPGQSPLLFALRTIEHAPLLVGTELGVPGVDFYPFLPTHLRVALIAVCLIVLALAAAAIVPIVRRDRVMRFFLVGALLSVVPFCATMPSTRLLLIPSIGLLAVIARVLGDVADRAIEGGRSARFGAMFTAILAGLGHVFLSPPMFVLQEHQMVMLEGFLAKNADGLPRDPTMSEQRLVVVNAPDATFIGYVAFVLDVRGVPSPRALLTLGVGTRPLTLERRDEKTVVLRSSVGLMQPAGTDLLTRGENDPPQVGWKTRVSDIDVEITSVNAAGWPNEAVFTFPGSLEDRRYRWVTWKDQTLKPFAIPRIGERVDLPAQTPQLF